MLKFEFPNQIYAKHDKHKLFMFNNNVCKWFGG